MDERKYISFKEFRETGYLQELNRQFLHPLGMALEFVTNEDDTGGFARIWDCRDESGGVVYSEFPEESISDCFAKEQRVLDYRIRCNFERKRLLGFTTQPIPNFNRPKPD